MAARLKHWDYRWKGAYFITICTKNRIHYFGKIKNAEMQLSPLGIIADILWHETKNHAKNVELGPFVVMPDHVHAILILTKDVSKDDNRKNNCNDNALSALLHATKLTRPPSTRISSIGKNEGMSKISPKPGLVSTIIRSYKSAVTKHAHRLGFEFHWQPGFYDHIIRNGPSFQKIAKYIINNPAKWKNNKI